MIRVYMFQECPPCKEVAEKLQSMETNEEIEVVDISTDEGFDLFEKEVLSKQDGAVPSAYKDGKRCLLGFGDDGALVIDCEASGETTAPAAPASPSASPSK